MIINLMVYSALIAKIFINYMHHKFQFILIFVIVQYTRIPGSLVFNEENQFKIPYRDINDVYVPIIYFNLYM